MGNAFVNATTQEKVYAICGPEFGPDREGSVVVIHKALYGLATSCERWHAHLSDTLRALGFNPTRFDQDVWIRLGTDEKHYEYICTHVDDFMIVARDPTPLMDKLQDIYTIKSISKPDYYLGNDYKKNANGNWTYGCKKYVKEVLVKVE